jgi:hypothetical protein
MSEGVVIALITAAGSLLGGILGQFIAASATVQAASIKNGAKLSSSNKNEKSFLWSGVLVGTATGTVITLIILSLLRTTPPKSIDAISGTWVGTAKSGDFEYDAKFIIGTSCEVGSVCGTFEFPTISCSGTLTITEISGKLYRMRENDLTSGCLTTPSIQNYFQLLPDGTLLYVYETNDYPESRAILHKLK